MPASLKTLPKPWPPLLLNVVRPWRTLDTGMAAHQWVVLLVREIDT